MDTKLIVSASPHLRSEETTAGLMANVIVALTPCVVASAIIFGLRALLVTAVSVVACVAFEWLYCKLLKKANPNATVEVGSEELANKAIEAATTDDGKFETNAKKNIKAALKEGNNDKYVWYAYFEAEGKNETDKAQAIANEILKTETNGSVTIGTNKAVNSLYVGIPGKYNIKAGDEFVLSMKEFTVTSDDGKTTTDWIMAVVTCKAVENK